MYRLLNQSNVAQLLFLAAEDAEKDIHLYINCPCGSTSAGFAIYDTMKFIKPDVSTFCVGMAASMGSILLTAGAPGKRFALPSAEIMLHQPWGGAQGQASDIQIRALHIQKTKDTLYRILSETTKQSIEKITFDCDRDFFLSAAEGKEYGLIDKVVENM